MNLIFGQGRRQRLASALITTATVVVVAAAGTACGTSGGRSSSGGVSVVASFYPLAEIAGRVGGSRVIVKNLTPAGAEPHDFELTSKSVDDVLDADVVLYLGRGFQPAVERAVSKSKARRVDLLGDVPGADPHVWLDPQRMEAMVAEVRAALGDVDPAGATTFAANAAPYVRELDGVDNAYRTGLADCDRRTIVTAHAAFGHLAARYGLTQEAITGLAPELEPNPVRLAELADEARTKGLTTIFTETLVSPKVAETLAREAGVRTAVLDPIEGLSAA